MKIYLSLFTLVILVLFACKKEDVKVKSEIVSDVTSGSWKISHFIDSGDDETAHFAGYTFTFQENGVLKASNGSTVYEGTWSISDSNSNDDSPDDLHFNIQFLLSNDFEDLNDDWEIKDHTSTKIELYDVSGGNGGTDELTFVKI